MNNELMRIDPRYLNLFSEYMEKSLGIFTEDSKKDMLARKIAKIMQDESIENIAEFYHFVVAPPVSETHKRVKNSFIDSVTVHKTNFFRENNHFEFIKRNLNQIISKPSVQMSKELRVWSSAASTGEEPYTLAMLFKQILPPDINVRILATDISPGSIRKCLDGVYKFGAEDHITNEYIHKYFVKRDKLYYITDDIKKMVTFRVFNLMDPFPFQNPFDIIFCRNVMIYFDRDVQEKLVNKFYKGIAQEGLLFIGHSESLIQIKHDFVYHEPTIYKKTTKKNNVKKRF